MADLALQVEFLLAGLDDANGNDLTGGKVYTYNVGTDILEATADATEANKLHDADGGFSALYIGAIVYNLTDSTQTTVSGYVDPGELNLTDDIMEDGDDYRIIAWKTTWEDYRKVTPHDNPIILGAYGRRLVFADGDYKFVITDADDTAIATYDGLQYVRTGPIYIGDDGEFYADTDAGTVQITESGEVLCEG